MSSSRRAPWEENIRKIKETYPSVGSLDWSRAMDSDAFAHVMGDLLKAEGKRSRPGKRPALSRPLAEAELAKLSGDSYAESDFKTAFRALTYGRSIRGIANKVGLQKDYVHRLLNGTSQPSFEAMEKIAQAYRKDPSYFLEYRIAYVLMVMDQYLTDSPETATVWYLRMKGKKK